MRRLSMITAVLVLSGGMANGQRMKDVPQKVDRSTVDGRVRTLNNVKQPLTPQKLWELGRVSAERLTPDGRYLIYAVANYDLETNTTEKNLFRRDISSGEEKQLTTEKGGESVVHITADNKIVYLFKGDLWRMNLDGGDNVQWTHTEGKLANVKFSPDEKHILYSQSVLVNKFHSKDKYEDLPESNVFVYDDLDYRHWDTFNDGKYQHPFVAAFDNGTLSEEKDILADKPFYSPQAPFGGAEDFIWSPDGKSILYVTKQKTGKEYASSTNTDIFRYDLENGQVTNLTEGMYGYDTHPEYSPNGRFMTWTSMKTDGYEADKNDIYVLDTKQQIKLNLTGHWDGTVNSFYWSKDSKKIYFTAPIKGTIQLFEVSVPWNLPVKYLPKLTQISEGEFDITGIVGEYKGGLIVSSTKITRAAELYQYDFKKKTLSPVTTVNDEAYANIVENKVEGRFTKASDGADLFSWVIYPPDFDPNKKYPTLLYCQGGPQSAVSQFYSLRWNLQLIASQGYIVVAPNRRGMPGWGVKWNEDISKDWGGQAIRDYLSAIDDVAAEPYVDKNRLGAVGASYGGYSVFMLAGVHEGRFKTFISHCGLFNMQSWYGTTEELFFANYDLGGPYWEEANTKSYHDFNPIHHVEKWNTPILIIQGGKDYRVPIGQGLEAFQVAQLKGVKSRLVYLPDENHWVLSGHNAQVWQREFFSWLEETL